MAAPQKSTPRLATGAARDAVVHLPRWNGAEVSPSRLERQVRYSPELAATAVYDGRVYLGDISEHRSGQWEAAVADGRSLGLFTSPAAAVHAVLAAKLQAGPR